MNATDRLIRLYTVTDPTEAELIKNLLNEYDIECAIGGERQAGLAGVLRIDITVWEKDFEAAMDVLDRHRKKTNT